MNEAELRELDVQVHRALWPEDEVKPGKETWARRGHGKLPSFFVLKGYKYVPVPHYTTDITAWEPVYALKPEWRWFQQEEPDATRVVVHTCGEWEFFDVWVEPFEATGLAAYALGRARCVIAWAGRGEG